VPGEERGDLLAQGGLCQRCHRGPQSFYTVSAIYAPTGADGTPRGVARSREHPAPNSSYCSLQHRNNGTKT
jgi:hypothetical protein